MSLHIGIPLFIAAAVLQAGLLPHLRAFGGQPDLIVILVIVSMILVTAMRKLEEWVAPWREGSSV